MDGLAGGFLIFFATIDPVGTLTLFVGLTATIWPKDRPKIAPRAVGYSAAILVSFIVLGQLFLGSPGIRLVSFQLAGGIIFFLFGVQMVLGPGLQLRARALNLATTSQSPRLQCLRLPALGPSSLLWF